MINWSRSSNAVHLHIAPKFDPFLYCIPSVSCCADFMLYGRCRRRTLVRVRICKNRCPILVRSIFTVCLQFVLEVLDRRSTIFEAKVKVNRSVKPSQCLRVQGLCQNYTRTEVMREASWSCWRNAHMLQRLFEHEIGLAGKDIHQPQVTQ